MVPTLIQLVVAILIAALFVYAIKAMPRMDETLRQFALILVYLVVGVFVILKLAALFTAAFPT